MPSHSSTGGDVRIYPARVDEALRARGVAEIGFKAVAGNPARSRSTRLSGPGSPAGRRRARARRPG